MSIPQQQEDPVAVLERMLDESQWPTYRNRNQHSRLMGLADEAYKRGTYDGYLSYVLMTSQACEDFVRITLKNAQFTLQICLAIQGFGWRFPKKQTGAALDKFMFGQILDMLDHSVDFSQKSELIDACKELSNVRNQLIHELDSGVSLQEIKKHAETCKSLCDDIVHAFNNADEHFSGFFLDIVRDPEWDRMLRRNRHRHPGEEARLDALSAKLSQARETSPVLPRSS